jgi:hypothetical protein
LNKALKFIGVDTSFIRTHSFRIFPFWQRYISGRNIKKLGRWKSDAFKRYIR